jgi:biotin carboxyl carrier protein
MSQRIVTLDGREIEVSLETGGGTLRARDTDDRSVELVSISEGEAVLLIEGERIVVPYYVDGERVEFVLRGETYRTVVTAKTARRQKRHREHSMSAPMPGVVLKLFVEEQQKVSKGAPLLILEAMKMEHQIVAPYDGRIVTIACAIGELVQPGVDLIEIEPEES